MSAKDSKIQKEGNGANKSADIIAQKTSGAPELVKETKDLSVEPTVDRTLIVPSTPALESQSRMDIDTIRSSAGTSKNPLLKSGMQLFIRYQRGAILTNACFLYSEFCSLL